MNFLKKYFNLKFNLKYKFLSLNKKDITYSLKQTTYNFRDDPKIIINLLCYLETYSLESCLLNQTYFYYLSSI